MTPSKRAPPPGKDGEPRDQQLSAPPQSPLPLLAAASSSGEDDSTSRNREDKRKDDPSYEVLPPAYRAESMRAHKATLRMVREGEADGWRPVCLKQGVQISSKHRDLEPEGDRCKNGCLVRGTVSFAPFPPQAVLYVLSLPWNHSLKVKLDPNVAYARFLRQFNNRMASGHVRLKPVFPTSSRDSVFLVEWRVVEPSAKSDPPTPEHAERPGLAACGSIVVSSCSIGEGCRCSVTEPTETIRQPPGSVRSRVQAGGWVIDPVPDPATGKAGSRITYVCT